MAKYKVYVTDGRHESYDIEREMLAKVDAELKVCQCVTDEDIIRECADADGILLDMAPMTEKAVNALTNCKIINRYGVGFDNVAVDACTAKGIQVTNVPDYCAEDVSDHALALIMTCLRQTALRDRLVRQGEWNIHGVSFRLTGKVLGVLGFGRIARALVKKTSGFGFSKVLVYDPYVPAEACAALGAALVIALARPAAAFAHNLAVSSLNLLELVLGRRVVGVQIGVVLLALLAVGFFDGLLVGTGLDAQYAVRVGHCVPFLLGAGLGFLARVAFTSAYLLQTPA